MAKYNFRIIKANSKVPIYGDRVSGNAITTPAQAIDAAKTAVGGGVLPNYESSDIIDVQPVPEEALCIGTIADDPATANSTGTISGKLRYLTNAIGTLLTNSTSLLTNSTSLLTNSTSLLTNVSSLLTNFTSLFDKLPTALSDGGNFKTAIAEALPSGTNTIGKVTTVNTAAPSFATAQVTVDEEKEIVPARPTRRRVLFVNNDDTNAVYLDSAELATTFTGFKLVPGVPQEFRTTAAIRGIAGAGSPIISVLEEFD